MNLSATLLLATILFHACRADDVVDVRGNKVDKGEGESLSLAVGGITRPVPVPPGVYSIVGSINGTNTTLDGLGTIIRIQNGAGLRNSDGIRKVASDLPDVFNKAGQSIDYNEHMVQIIVPKNAVINDEAGAAIGVADLVGKRINVQATLYDLAANSYKVDDSIFYFVAQKIWILPTSNSGGCGWNTSNFTTVVGGCKDLQTGLIWNTTTTQFSLSVFASGLNTEGVRPETFCENMKSAKLGGLENWDLPSQKELQQIAGFQPWRVHFNAGSALTLRGGASGIPMSSRFPDSLIAILGQEAFDAFRENAKYFVSRYDTRGNTFVEMLSGSPITKTKDLINCSDSPAFGEGSNCLPGANRIGMCVSRPNGVILPPDPNAIKPYVRTVRPDKNAYCKLQDAAFKTDRSGCQDIATQLSWSKNNGGSYSYSGAGQFCNELGEHGFADWQLPTAEQMKTLAGPDKAVTHFQGTIPGRIFWVSGGGRKEATAIEMATGKAATYKVNKTKQAAICVRRVKPGDEQVGGIYAPGK